jgi:tetratricopeptide (TPR) repeat protein
MGNFHEALLDYEQSWRLSSPDQDQETLRRYGIHNGVALRCSFSQALACTGHGGRAKQLLSEVEPLARSANVPATLGFALSSIASSYQIGRFQDAKEFATNALEEVSRYQLVAWSSSLMCTVAALLMEEGDFEAAEPLLKDGINYRRSNMGLIFVPYHLTLRATCLYALGRDGQGQKVEDEAMEMLKHGTEQWSTADIHRLLAVAGFKRDGKLSRAVKRLEKSIHIAREQGAIFWELRAINSLADLLMQSDPERALQEVTQVIDRYPQDGHGMADFQDALQIQEQLNGQ